MTSASVWAGAATMAVFVVGTAPLFSLIGSAANKAAPAWKGRLAAANLARKLVFPQPCPSAPRTLAAALPGSSYPTSDQTVLPENGDVEIDLGTPTADRISCSCAMGMYSGVIPIS